MHFLPNVAGFVGGDHVAMLLATGLYEANGAKIGIDIGTNTEVTLAAKGTITSLSCASGPAFEGGHIKNGMRASDGAIEKVEISDDGVQYRVIGDMPPMGICGSGILDTVSEMRKREIIDERGRLRNHLLVRQGKDGAEFVLALGNITRIKRDISLTQRDIGEIQLAKAAIRTGINVLLSEADLQEDEIDGVIIAGAFGSYINVESAINIGMFPTVSLNKFSQIGNAAGMGAKLALMSKKSRIVAGEIAKKSRYIELTAYPDFTREFSNSLRFP